MNRTIQKTIVISKTLYSEMMQVIDECDINLSQLVRLSLRNANQKLISCEIGSRHNDELIRTTINLRPHEESILFSLMEQTGLQMSSVIRASVYTFISGEGK